MTAADKPSIGESIHGVIGSFSDVVQNEVRLAKAEAAAGIKDVKAGLATLAVALAVAIPSITLLSGAAVDLIVEQTQLTRSSAGALVGAALAIACALLILIGRSSLASHHAGMREVRENVAQDIKAVTDTLK